MSLPEDTRIALLEQPYAQVDSTAVPEQAQSGAQQNDAMTRHKLSAAFPALKEEEYAALKESIARDALREAIWTRDGAILDGWHRYRACLEAGVEPRFREYEGDGPAHFVLSQQRARRNWTSSQAAAVAATLEPDLAEEADRRAQEGRSRGGGDRRSAEYRSRQFVDESGLSPAAECAPPPQTSSASATGRERDHKRERTGRSDEQAALVVGTNRQYVRDFKKIEKADPALAEQVRQDEVSIPQANRTLSEREAAWEEAVRNAEERGVALTARDVKRAVGGVVKRKEKEEKKQQRHAERELATEHMAEIPFGERVRLVHADLREALAGSDVPADSVDLVLTDPPYPREYLPLYSDLGRHAARVLKPGSALVAMVGQSYLPEVLARIGEHLEYHWTIAYLTPGGQSPQLPRKRLNAFWKPVVVFAKGSYAGKFFGDVARSQVNGNDKDHHHWGQSEAGMSDLLERLSEPGQMVVDPFLGGGTTALVAAAGGRRFFGCDTDAGAVETTRDRLRELARAWPGSGEEGSR